MSLNTFIISSLDYTEIYVEIPVTAEIIKHSSDHINELLL